MQVTINGENKNLAGGLNLFELLDEFVTLQIDLFRRVFAAGHTECCGLDLASGFTLLLFHHQLNRQTVTIPARNIRRVETAHGFALDDDVLKHDILVVFLFLI